MREKLYPHNRTAYESVLEAFETSQRTCVVHPTGTGKSYIVAAVAEHFRKVLILAPNVFILDQQQRALKHKGAEYHTYAWLTMYVLELTERYDLIVLDEFHRLGADEWGAAVELLLECQPQVKVLGTSATPVRYLDNERDMSEDLFHGKVASFMSIADAWVRRILPQPKYVTGIFRFDAVAGDIAKRIYESKRMHSEEKAERLTRLKNASLEWERSLGMPVIIKRHLDPQIHRVIVFVPDVKRMDQIQESVLAWFSLAGFEVGGCYIINSRQSDRENHKQMQYFEEDDKPGVKLMFSYNMLNEGIHVPDVGAVIMLRSTESRNIYLQQLGRALTTANSERPVVLDMVDNITSTLGIQGLADEFNRMEMLFAEKNMTTPRRFEIYDYVQTVRQLLKKLSRREISFATVEERIQIIKDFVEKHQRLPHRRYEPELYRHWAHLLIRAKNHPEVIALRERYGHKTIEDRKLQAIAFINEHGRKPYCNPIAHPEEMEDYRNYRLVLQDHRKHPDPRIEKMLEPFTHKSFIKKLRKSLHDFVEENHRFPMMDATNPDEFNLRTKCVYYIEELKQFRDTAAIFNNYYKRRATGDEVKERMRKFLKEKGRRPLASEKEYFTWARLLQSEDPEIQEMIAPYRGKGPIFLDVETYAQPVLDFIRTNRRKPKSSRINGEGNIYEKYRRLLKHASEPKVKLILDEIEQLLSTA